MSHHKRSCFSIFPNHYDEDGYLSLCIVHIKYSNYHLTVASLMISKHFTMKDAHDFVDSLNKKLDISKTDENTIIEKSMFSADDTANDNEHQKVVSELFDKVDFYNFIKDYNTFININNMSAIH